MTSFRSSQRLLQAISPLRSASRYQIRQWHPRPIVQRRLASTAPVPLPYKPRSKLRPFVWAFVFAFAGYAMGKSMSLAVKLFESVERDSEEDILLLKAVILAADGIPFVQEMLQKDGELDSDWDEVAVFPGKGDTMVRDALGGSMGLVTPRAFWNGKEQELVMVVYYGGGLCGWPGIAHGGCTATVLLEGMGRALNCLQGGIQSIRPPDPSELGLTYLKPVLAQNYYLLRAKLVSPDEAPRPDTGIGAEKDMAKKLHQERSGVMSQLNTKYNIECVLEDLKGKQCMRAKGVWDVI